MRSRAADVFAFVALFTLFNGDGMRDLLSPWGFGGLAAVLLGVAVVVLVRRRSALRALLARSEAVPILVFMALCLVSVLWSEYRLFTLAGSAVQVATAAVALSLLVLHPPLRLIGIFTAMLHVHLVVSLLFEVVVATLVPGGRLMPFFTDYGENAPGAYYWSQGLLFTGERIQGIAANANLTCFIALLALITAASLLAARRIRPPLALAMIALDLLMLALTRSATVAVAAAMAAVVAVLALGYRRAGRGGRTFLTVGALCVIAVVALSSSRVADPVLRILGRGEDLTGRQEIWRSVGNLVTARPVGGWGWISYWAPIEPFEGLVIRGGVQYLQAHSAYLDVAMQLGVVGTAALVVVVGALLFRAVRLATLPGALNLLPLMLAAALLTQALAESRLLIEGNWALLVVLSVALPWVPTGALAPEDGTSARAPLAPSIASPR